MLKIVRGRARYLDQTATIKVRGYSMKSMCNKTPYSIIYPDPTIDFPTCLNTSSWMKVRYQVFTVPYKYFEACPTAGESIQR